VQRVGEPVDVLHGDDRQAFAMPRPRTGRAATAPSARHHHALDLFGRHPGFVALTNVASSTPRPSARLFNLPTHSDVSTPGWNMIGV